jgi:hypothetical protein
MATLEQLAALPKTPGSVVRASAAYSPRVRAWELCLDGAWRDVWGARRTGAQLKDVTVLHVQPAADGSERAA